jgi:hypothetical protein
VIDGVDGRAHHVHLPGIDAFADAPPAGGIVEVRRFGGPDDPRPTLVLANRSDIDLDRQVTAPGATWLDYRLVERAHAARQERVRTGSALVVPHSSGLCGGTAECELRLSGAPYEEIALAGGGILSTVRATRAASEDDLVRATLQCHGSTRRASRGGWTRPSPGASSRSAIFSPCCGAGLSAEIGMAYTPAAGGEMVVGTFASR